MPKTVIEVPERLKGVGEAMAAHLAELERALDRQGGGKAVDYAAVEREVAASVVRTELASHGAILQSLDVDVPAVIIGGKRYTRVGSIVESDSRRTRSRIAAWLPVGNRTICRAEVGVNNPTCNSARHSGPNFSINASRRQTQLLWRPRSSATST